MIGRGPDHRARLGIEGHNPRALRAVGAADVGDHAPVFDQRRAGGAKESLSDVEARPRVDVPDRPAGRDIESRASDLPRRTCRRGRRRRPARPAGLRRIRNRRDMPSGRQSATAARLSGRSSASTTSSRRDAMEQDEPIAGHDRAGEALADMLLPHLSRSARGPRRGQRRTGIARRFAAGRETAASRPRKWPRPSAECRRAAPQARCSATRLPTTCGDATSSSRSWEKPYHALAGTSRHLDPLSASSTHLSDGLRISRRATCRIVLRRSPCTPMSRRPAWWLTTTMRDRG